MKRIILILVFFLFINCETLQRDSNYGSSEKSGLNKEKFDVKLLNEDKRLFSKTKEDFKCIKLGDHREILWKKLKYLDETGEIKCYGNLYKWFWKSSPYVKKNEHNDWNGISYNFINYTTDIVLYLLEGEDKLYKILIFFPYKTADYYDTDIKQQYFASVKLFSNKYGKPKYNNRPEFFKMKSRYIIFGAEWDLENKKILIGISSSSFKYSCQIMIIDKKLEAKIEAKQKRIEKINIDKTVDDF